MAWPLKPVVLCFPDHSSGVSRQAWGQEAVFQHLLAGRRFLCLVGGRPVLFGGRLDKRRELRDYPRDHRLRRIEYFAQTSSLCSVAYSRMPQRQLLAE